MRRASHADPNHGAAAHLGEKIADVAAGEKPPVLDDPDPITDVCELGKDVTADEDRLAEPLEPLEQPPHLDPRPRIETAGGLVEEEDLRIMKEDAG